MIISTKEVLRFIRGKLNANNTFRIANIGDITKQDMENFISILAEYIEKIKIKSETKENGK